MNQILRRAMRDSDKYVIEMDYADAKGNRTHRVVSPHSVHGKLSVPRPLPLSRTTSTVSDFAMQKHPIGRSRKCSDARPDRRRNRRVGHELTHRLQTTKSSRSQLAILELFVYEGCCSRRMLGNPRRASALRNAVFNHCRAGSGFRWTGNGALLTSTSVS